MACGAGSTKADGPAAKATQADSANSGSAEAEDARADSSRWRADLIAPATYDGWYDSARGRWIGETELRLTLAQLQYKPGERMLDVGCGTGWFTRRLAALPRATVTGIDADNNSLAFARTKDARSTYIAGDAHHLPFAADSFDRVVSVTALCFMADWPQALQEMVRVTRHRFAIGLLNRHSLLWRQKGRGAGVGTYRGAHWHRRREVMAALARLPVTNVQVRTAVWFPSGSAAAQTFEHLVSNRCPFGSFLLVAGDKAAPPPDRPQRGPSPDH